MSDADRGPTTAQERAMEEMKREQRQLRQTIKSDAELFQLLIKHPAWPRYIAMLEVVGNTYNKQIMAPLENSFQAVRTEFAKGALTGIQAAASMPHLKIREAADLKPTDGED